MADWEAVYTSYAPMTAALGTTLLTNDSDSRLQTFYQFSLDLHKTVADSRLKLTSLTRAVMEEALSAFVPSILFRCNPQR